MYWRKKSNIMCDNDRDGGANFTKDFNARDGRSSFGIR